jgi:hypothetical protein
MFNPNVSQSNPELRKRHLADLCGKSGLNKETIDRLAYSYVTLWEAWQTLGWKPSSGGVFMPYVINGQLLGCRVRFDKPYIGRGGKEAKYGSPRGESIHLYIPPTVDLARFRDTTEPLLITEGEKKAAKAVQEGLKSAGIGGVDSWPCCRPRASARTRFSVASEALK